MAEALTRDNIYELLRDYSGTDMLRRSYHKQGDDEAALREEAHAKQIAQTIMDAFDAMHVAADDDHGWPGIAWAMRHLQTVAMTGERSEQIAACEAMVRCVCRMAGMSVE